MGRRVLAFFLGMLFGIIFLVGSLIAGVFIAATVIHPSDLFYDADKYLGELADMSLYDIFSSVSALYNEKAGKLGPNGKYFTLGEFCEKYNINPNELFGGKQVHADVLDLPIFDLFGSNSEEAIKQVKVSVIPALLNMFLGGESGDGSANALFPDSALEKLSAHSITELFEEDGIGNVFAEVCIYEVAMGMLPAERTYTDYELGTQDNAMMWALGQAKLGPILGGIEGNVMLQFKENGAFSALGGLQLVELLGDNSPILNAFVGNNSLSDLIDAEGNIYPDDMLNAVYIGDLVQLQRNKLDENDAVGFDSTGLADETNDLVLLKNNEGKYILQHDASKASDTEPVWEYYEAQLNCKNEEADHQHQFDCYGFVWYGTEATTDYADSDLVKDGMHYSAAKGVYAAIADITVGTLTGGDSKPIVDKFMNVPLSDLLEGQDYPEGGVFDNLSDMTIGELVNGGIDNMYLGQLLGFRMREVEKPDGNVVPLFKNNAQPDDKPNKYLIEASDGTISLSTDQKTWYEGQLVCIHEEHTHTAECGAITNGIGESCGLNEHKHNANCYGFVWYEACENAQPDHHTDEWLPEEDNDSHRYFVPVEGMMLKLSNKQVNDLDSLDDALMEFTLEDVMGENVPDILVGIKDTPIGDLNDAINQMYLGELLGFRRRPVDGNDYTQQIEDLDGNVIENVMGKLDGETILLAKFDGEAWYEARLTCITEEVAHTSDCGGLNDPALCNDETHHLHDESCYGFVWYEKCENTQLSHDHSAEGEWLPEEDNDEQNWYFVNTDMMGKLADEQVENLHNLDEAAKKLTLGDVMGDDLPGMLGSLKDTPIGNLDAAIDELYLGELLEFRLRSVDESDTPFGEFSQVVCTAESEPTVKSTESGDKFIRLKDGVWYEAEFTCIHEEHQHSVECGAITDGKGENCGLQEHAHDETCYGFVWYKVCDITELDHDHTGEWLPETDNAENNYYIKADGMMGKLSNEKVADLDSIDKTVQTFTLRDVMGEENVPPMLKSLQDTPIEQLGDAIEEVYLGDFLEFHRRPVEDWESYEEHLKEGKVEVREKDGKYAKTDDGKDWYEAVFTCDLAEVPHTQECGGLTDPETCKEPTHHVHGVDCYDFVWYELLEADHEHDPESEWVDGEDHYLPTTGMMAKLARKKVNEMKNLDETVQDFTLDDVLGENVPDMLKSIKDTKIKDLDSAINGMYLGDFLEFRRKTTEEMGESIESYNAKTLPAIIDEEGNIANGEVRLDEADNAIVHCDDVWYQGQLTCTKKEIEHTAECGGQEDPDRCTEPTHHQHDASCYGFVWYKVCDNAELDHDHHAEGEWLPETDNPNGDYYVKADGMMGKLANEKISDMGDLQDTIQNFTLADVMGENIPASLETLADTPIGELGDAIDAMYLGSFLQFRRRPIAIEDINNYTIEIGETVKSNAEGTAFAILQDDQWFEARLTCTINHDHEHTEDCFGVVWYQQCTTEHDHADEWSVDGTHYIPATGVLSRMSGLKVNELNSENITKVVEDTPLGEVMSLEKSNGLLRELAEVRIGDLSDELDAVYVGIAMNFHRNEVDRAEAESSSGTWTEVVTDKAEHHKRKDKVFQDKDGNYYILDVQHNIYYEAQLVCTKNGISDEHVHEENGGDCRSVDGQHLCGYNSNHVEHSFQCYGYVWYNGDTSEEHTHGEGSCKRVVGLNEKISNLRIDELDGSGLTAIAVNLTVADLIDSEMMSLSEDNVALLSIIFDKTGDCKLLDFITQIGKTPTAFWQNKHEGKSPAETDHGLEWQQMKLSQFISEMLNAIANINSPNKG